MNAAAMRCLPMFVMALVLVVGIAGHTSAPAQAAGWIMDPDGAP